MTTAVSGNAQSPSTNRVPDHARTPDRGQQPSPQDLRDMAEAFTAARNRAGGQGQQAIPAKGKQAKDGLRGELAKGEPLPDAPQMPPPQPGSDPLVQEREAKSQHQGEIAGLGGQPTPMAITVPAGAIPPPHVDASAFAQLMTQLWLRENGKGTKEITVRFGDAGWPTTGARLVRNAAGALDIQLLVGGAGGYPGDLGTLRDRFAQTGVAVGALGVEEDRG